MANTSTNKPVNDLIKFWADKQDKKGPAEPVSRSLRKPLFPNASLPTTPLDGSFFSKAPFGDIPSNSPPSPTKQSQNIHSLITDDNINTTIDIQTIPKKNEEKMDVSPLSQSSKEETSPSTKDNSISRLRDKDLNGRDISNRVGPPTRKVTDLVSKFEKVASPTNSVSTPSKLNRNYQSFPTSPLALAPINRNQLTPEPLLLSSPTSLTINTKALRRQTVPEPLSISLKQISDEPESISSSPVQSTAPKKDYDPTSISPINPIDNKTTENHVKEVQTQKKQTQETSSNQKKLPEQNSNPVIIPSIKRSDSEPLQPSTSPVQSDYLDFLSATLQNFQTSSFEIASISAPWKSTDESAPISSQNKNKKVSKSIIHSKHLSFGTKKTFTSREITLKNNEPNPSHYETPDLLPQPEPISPIRLDFSDFLLSPNGSSPNLNSNDKQDGEKEKRDFLMSTNQSDIHKVVKPEVPKKDEYTPTTKHMSLKGTVHLIENLKRYLQPNKFKNPNEVNVSAQKVASQ